MKKSFVLLSMICLCFIVSCEKKSSSHAESGDKDTLKSDLDNFLPDSDVPADIDSTPDKDSAPDEETINDNDSEKDADVQPDETGDADAIKDADIVDDFDSDVVSDSDVHGDADSKNDEDDEIEPDNDESDEDESENETDVADADILQDSDVPPLPFDCNKLLPAPAEYITIPFTASEDFEFDTEGYLISNDNGNLVRQTMEGEIELLIPGVSSVGMRYLANGDLIVANMDTNTVDRIFPDGGIEVIVSGLNYPNGVEIDPKTGLVYVSELGAGKILEINPDTKKYKYIAENILNANGISFGPDYKTLYFVSWGTGLIYKQHKNEDGTWEMPEVFAKTPSAPEEGHTSFYGCEDKKLGDSCSDENGNGGVCVARLGGLGCKISGGFGDRGGLDGLNIDACGNVYVTEWGVANIYRFSPDGKFVELLFSPDDAAWIPNIHWGKGFGGWSDTTIYVNERNTSQLYAVDLGIPAKEYFATHEMPKQ